MDNSNYSPSFFRFEDLRVYQKALDYYIWVQVNTEMFPNSESSHLVKSFVDTAMNISGKIAEGSSKNKTQFVFHLKEAKTSIRQCVMFTTVASKLNYFSEEQEETSRNYLMELTKMLGALIGSIQREHSPSHSSVSRSDSNDEDIVDEHNTY
ncbi:MAG: four helix bundle protein [Bacteroidales bacterium]|jgi:four helix bundle protein|nr:four helix bundle protein [Bacteroidales bacterium]